MRILLDANIPKRLKNSLLGHDVQTARECGLQDLDDGPLIAAMAGQFDALVTCDKSLRFQQNLKDIDFAIIVLRARSNRIPDLEPLVPRLLIELSLVKPKDIRVVTAEARYEF